MWTHVDGIMSADPALVPSARVISELSYDEVAELSYFGARVLHPEAIAPLVRHRIPLRVRNPDNLDHAGTLIQTESAHVGLKAVTAVDGLCLTLAGAAFDMAELLNQVRALVGGAAAGPVIALQGYHRATVVFVVPTSEGPSAVDDLAARLRAQMPRWEVRAAKVIAALGSSRTLPEAGLLAYASGPGGRRLFAVAPEDAQAVVRHLHGGHPNPGYG
jgi:aspartate kinase